MQGSLLAGKDRRCDSDDIAHDSLHMRWPASLYLDTPLQHLLLEPVSSMTQRRKSRIASGDAFCRGARSLQQQCTICQSVLPSPYLLSLHIAEQHDSFFASQAAQRIGVFRCLVEGCSSTFSSAAQRHQHLADLHQIAPDSGFDR